MKLDPTSLKLFVCVVEEGTIAAAAERSHIAAAAVSKRLSELEAVLRTQLLTRTNKGVEPTAAGIALLNRARRVLHELDETYVQLREYASGIRGHVRVFANISAITQFLPREIKSFLDEHPQVQVDLEERTSPAITKAVADNIADVGVFTMIPHGQDLEILPYHSDELVVITPHGHPLAGKSSVSFADTLDFDYVGLHPGGAISLQLIKAASELNRTLKLRIQVTAYDALCLMVEAGLGIGVLPKHALRPYSQTLRIEAVPLTEPWAHRDLKICVRSFDSLPVAAKRLVDHLEVAPSSCHRASRWHPRNILIFSAWPLAPSSECGAKRERREWITTEGVRMNIAFVGLGQMGKPMAMNLLKSGAELLVNSASDDSYSEFEAKGARSTKDLKRVAEADLIFLCLPSSEVVRQVLLGEQGLAERLVKGQTVVDTSTITYSTTLEISQALAARGVAFLDAPVSGVEARAIEGTLTVMCGGKRETFEAVKPYLACFGNNILYMGAAGSGQLTKLINQLLFDINCAALAEILPMAVKMGLDAEKVGTVVNGGTGRSYASEFFIPRILENGFSAGYPMKHAYKDLESAAELGAKLGIPMPVLAAATATYQMALLRGHGERDKGAMILVFEELLGVKFRKQD